MIFFVSVTDSIYLRHLSLQYFTSCQTFAHFFRQVKGRLQVMQIFCGRFSFLIFFKAMPVNDYRLLILFIEMVLCRLHLKRLMPGFLFCRCFWLMPLLTLLRQRLKLLRFNSLRMMAITAASFLLNWNAIASKGVLSSQAISIMRSISFWDNSFSISLYFI